MLSLGTMASTKKKSAGSAAVFDALNSQVKEREAERRAQIQRERAAELAALKGRNANIALAQGESIGVDTYTELDFGKSLI